MGLREEVLCGQGWGVQEGDQYRGPSERTGGEAARGEASGGRGLGRWLRARSRLFGEGGLDSLPRGGEWSGRGRLSETQGPAGRGWGGGLRAWAGDTPAVLRAGSRSVSTSWELRRCRLSGPAPQPPAPNKTCCGRKSAVGSGSLYVLEPSGGFSGPLECDTWSDTPECGN